MRTHHVFRPTAFDTLEDRVVMATSASAVSGLALSDVLLIQGAVSSAFSTFGNEIINGFDTIASFPSTPFTPVPPTIPPTVNPVIAPTLAIVPATANANVTQLAVQLSDLLSPLRRSGRTLVPAMLATVAGPGAGSLSDVVSSTFSRLIATFNLTQGPNTTLEQNAAIEQAESDISALRTQLFSEIAAARLAVSNQLNLFANTPQGRAGRRPRFDLASAQGVVNPAYATFATGLTSALATYQTGLTSALAAISPTAPDVFTLRNTAFTNARNTLQASVIGLTVNLNNSLGSVIQSSLGSSGAGNRVSALVSNQILGAGDGSLLDNLTEQIGTLTIPSTGTNFSTSALVFGSTNLVAQSRLTTAGLLSIGSA